MMQDFESAAWATHHGQWSASVGAALSRLAGGFACLQHRRFAAPWRRTTCPAE